MQRDRPTHNRSYASAVTGDTGILDETIPFLEWILGFRLRGTTLVIDPCVPKAWPRFDIVFCYHSARYEIAVLNPNGVSRGVVRVSIDGKMLETNGARIVLSDDGTTHTVEVMLG